MSDKNILLEEKAQELVKALHNQKTTKKDLDNILPHGRELVSVLNIAMKILQDEVDNSGKDQGFYCTVITNLTNTINIVSVNASISDDNRTMIIQQLNGLVSDLLKSKDEGKKFDTIVKGLLIGFATAVVVALVGPMVKKS